MPCSTQEKYVKLSGGANTKQCLKSKVGAVINQPWDKSCVRAALGFQNTAFQVILDKAKKEA